MKDTKAIKLLRSLNKEEFHRLGKFLRSPFYNNAPTIIKLYEHLKKYYPGFDTKKLEKEKVWKKLFPDKLFNDNKYWNICFTFGKLMEKFLVILQLDAQPKEEKKILIKALGQRNIYKPFEKETKKLTEQIKKQSYQDIHSYSETMWLKHDYFFSPLTDKYGGAIYSVEDAMEDLDRFYVLAKLRLVCEIKNRERMFSKKVPLQLLDESIAVSEQYAEENFAFLMYKNVLDLYVPEKAEMAFENGKELLKDKYPLLSKHDQKEVMLNLRNYATRQINKGQTCFWKELLDLYKLGLELDLIVERGKISEAAFINIVNAGCVEKDFGWTENFINEHGKYLENNVRKDTNLICFGVLFYSKNDFDKVLESIGNHDFKNALFQINARILLLKAWYQKFLEDKNLFDLFLSKLDSDEKFFRRFSTIAKHKLVPHINFVLALKHLSNLIFQNTDPPELTRKMTKYINDERQLTSKKWLLEKVQQP